MGNQVANWIYGAGGFAKRLKAALENQGLSISGLVTQKDFETNFVFNQDDIFYLGIFNHIDDPKEIIDFLISKGVVNLINPSEAIKKVSNQKLDTYYLSSAHENLCTQDEINEIFNLLSDSTSKQILLGFYEYQTNGNIENLIRSADHTLQYLGTLLPEPYASSWLKGKVRWVDCGAYIGDTVEAVSKVSETNKAIFLNLEPDLNNYKNLKHLTSKLEIESINLNAACGDSSGVAKISDLTGLSSQISRSIDETDSSQNIPIFTLDEIAGSWFPTHIKMDIEGSEMEAIKGAVKIIKESRPKLAIAVYHKPRDIYEIPKYLSLTVPEYKYFLRAYGAHGYDTVLYAIPEEVK
jgi:FkbM family methyltransferase